MQPQEQVQKKIWIKSFTFPDIWQIENIPENDLPEPLLLELLGSRKNILFCEGKKGSNDEKIYNILFPNFTITPVESCFSVINFTKAFNKIPNITTKALGIIDSDHHEERRLEKLKEENVYSFSMTETENLLLDEDFLKILAPKIVSENDVISSIKSDVISNLNKELELQISNFVTTKINYYFNDSHVSKGNDLKKLEDNYNNFIGKVDIKEWYSSRKTELEQIISDENYSKALSVYNNKGLVTIVNRHFRILNFFERAIKVLQSENETHDVLKKHFPKELH